MKLQYVNKKLRGMYKHTSIGHIWWSRSWTL